MKKKDWIIILVVLALAGICMAVFTLFPREGNTLVRITVDDTLYGEYSLLEDQEISIGETNICEIRDGQVRMIWADCPDQLCIHQSALDEKGQGAIICLPNRVQIEVVGGGQSDDALDAVAG